MYLDRKWWILIGLGLSAMMIAVDATIVNTVLPQIQKSLSSTQSQLLWVISAYGISFSTLLTVLGRLGDILGRRLILYVAVSGFLLTSIGAGLSTSSIELIVFRFLQGIFGAAVFPCGLGLVADVFPKESQGKAIGIYSALLGSGFAFGPVIGGLLVSHLSWRWVFFINIPIVILSLIICLPLLKESSRNKEETIDWLGMLFFILGVGLIILGITEGGNLGWSHWLIIVSLCVGVLSLIIFYFIEKHVPMPICPFHLFMNKGVLLGTLCYIASISGTWPLIFFISLYLQTILHLSPTQTGFTLLAMTLMTAIVPPLAGVVYDKKGPLVPILLLFFTMMVGYFLQLFFKINGPIWLILSAFVIFGIGWGIGNGIGTPLSLSQFSDKKDAGIVSGAVVTVLNVVGVFLLATLGAIFRFKEKVRLEELLHKEGIHLTNSQEIAIQQLLSTPEEASNLLKSFGSSADRILIILKDSFMSGFQLLIAILFILTAVLFLVCLPFLKKITKKTY